MAFRRFENEDFSSSAITNFANMYLPRSEWVNCNLADQLFNWCDLSFAEFENCDLSSANLYRDDLRHVTFKNCNFTKADLSGTDLANTKFENCILTGTILDPEAELPEFHPGAFELSKTEPGYFYAYRTQLSRYYRRNLYELGKTYEAPVFSTSKTDDCHPGLYFALRDYFDEDPDYDGMDLVKVKIHVSDAFAPYEKFRCRKFEVVMVLPRGGVDPDDNEYPY